MKRPDFLPSGALIVGGTFLTALMIQPGLKVAFSIIGAGITVYGVMHFVRQWRLSKKLEQRDKEPG